MTPTYLKNSKPIEALPYKIAVLCDLRDARGRVLLIHRAKDPNKGLYSMIGGKLDTASGESPAQCARREIREEAEIDVAVDRLRLVGVVSETGFQGQCHWLMFVYRVIDPVSVEEKSISEGRLGWHPEEGVDALALPETDRSVIWPLMRAQAGRLFTVHIDCSGEQLRWEVEQRD